MMKRSFFLALSLFLLNLACKGSLDKKLEIKTPARKVFEKSSQKKTSGWFDTEALEKLREIIPEKYLMYPGKKLSSNPDIYWLRPSDENCYKAFFPGKYVNKLMNSLDFVHFTYDFEIGVVLERKLGYFAIELKRELEKKKLSLGAVGTFFSSGSAISPPGMSYKYQDQVLKKITCPKGKSGLLKTKNGWFNYKGSFRGALKYVRKESKKHKDKLKKTAKLAGCMIWSATPNVSGLLKKFGFRNCKPDSEETLVLLKGLPLWVYSLTLSHFDLEREIHIGYLTKKGIKLLSYECKRDNF